MTFTIDVYRVEFFVGEVEPFFSWCGTISLVAETIEEGENYVKMNNEEYEKGNTEYFFVLEELNINEI